MNGQELATKVREVYDSIEGKREDSYSDYEYAIMFNDLSDTLKDALKKELDFEFVEQRGGGEGGTEYCFSIFKVKNQYFRVEYSYISYDGFSFDDIDNWEEVEPHTVTKTEYRPI